MGLGLLKGERIEVPCTVEVENTFDSLHAHLRLDGGITIHPGDEVTVDGAPIEVPYGECATFRRNASIQRAGAIERLWTRLTGDFEFMELCEFSFSEGAAR
ncbi:hypothetical protein [Pararhizobium mangrovi]|uniref:Uncharacterized protein n=1 Tax=Pararhizobium mangrovi TaxID=2590452 RepID=A0A506UAL9_9HYPH|nr:hypothetical protein [Pararhizobium mangrovi]TPW30416.1 hypothetical protein FJU11_05245 [Pararhizobium mangrovi]